MRHRQLFCGMFLAVFFSAQAASEEIQIRSTELAKNLYLLQGKGGNVAAYLTDEGAVVIDSQFAEAVPALKAELARFMPGTKVLTLVNTHFHRDHVDGNLAMAPSASIIAHQKALTRLQAQADFPENGLPTETFVGEKHLELSGQTVTLMTMPASHTDTDLVVWFSPANVLHTGDLFFADRFPFIDLQNGGSVLGYIATVKELLKRIDETTQIIPGHGDLTNKAAYLRFLQMMEATLREVQELKQQGFSEDAIVEKGLSATWKSWHWNFITEERWIRTLLKA